jgi:hypothetical protein
MATTYNWTVTAMDCYPQEGGNTDVVFNVHWTCSGTDGTYSGSVYSTCAVPGPGNPLDGFGPTAWTRMRLRLLLSNRFRTRSPRPSSRPRCPGLLP